MINDNITIYIVYFVMVATFLGHLSTKSYETLTLFIATFILV